jgi:hypothetical protein
MFGLTLKRLTCFLFGHIHYMDFVREGIYWCWSAGAYNCLCRRCDFRWETTKYGQAALIKSRTRDPRIFAAGMGKNNK